MKNMGAFICYMYYFERLKEIEYGRPIRRLSVFVGPYGESFEYTGANIGVYNVAEIEDLIDRFGNPAAISFSSLAVKNDYEDWLCFVSDRDLSFRELRLLKQEIDNENMVK
jgi:hypothetical protein